MVSGNPRQKMQVSALDTARNYEKEALSRLRLMSLITAELEIKGKKSAGVATSAGLDEQYEDIPVTFT
jgi:COP9 signalosome complex subunit 1